MKISKGNSEHYVWGDGCDGWRLVKDPSLSVIHERMPGGTEEVRHYHQAARQFFFVLTGRLTIEMNGEHYELGPQEGLEIPPLAPHQTFNQTNADSEFLVISQPATRGDRTFV